MLKETFTEAINTERLLLKRFEMPDAPSALRNWASDPEIQHDYGEPVYSSLEEVEALLEKYIASYEHAGYYRCAIIEKRSEECIGQIAYFLVDAKNEFAEIEYCIRKFKFQFAGKYQWR